MVPDSPGGGGGLVNPEEQGAPLGSKSYTQQNHSLVGGGMRETKAFSGDEKSKRLCFQ